MRDSEKEEAVLRMIVEFSLNNGHKKWHGTQLIASEALAYLNHK